MLSRTAFDNCVTSKRKGVRNAKKGMATYLDIKRPFETIDKQIIKKNYICME